jgi:hypothetical protein
MNDTELDQALNEWQAPEPPPSLRAGLRARFPRAERRGFRRPLRWLLAGGLAVVAVVAMAQSRDAGSDNAFVRMVTEFYEHVAGMIEVHRVMALVSNVRHGEPKVWVDGAPGPPLEFRHSSTFQLQLPGEQPYYVTFWSRSLRGWKEAGRVQGNTIGFEAGGHQVRVECAAPLGADGMPVMVRRGE